MSNRSQEQLVGTWIIDRGILKNDDIGNEIERRLQNELKNIAISDWCKLFIDEQGFYRELTFPQSEMHGGGPKTLICIDEEGVNSKYDLKP